jgi:hypothetical protein
MYETYLCDEALKDYLSFLLREGFLEYRQGEKKFRTTEAGLKYLSSSTETRGCSHQCQKCGILYCCDYSRCDRPFQRGLCLRCARVVSCETQCRCDGDGRSITSRTYKMKRCLSTLADTFLTYADIITVWNSTKTCGLPISLRRL